VYYNSRNNLNNNVISFADVRITSKSVSQLGTVASEYSFHNRLHIPPSSVRKEHLPTSLAISL